MLADQCFFASGAGYSTERLLNTNNCSGRFCRSISRILRCSSGCAFICAQKWIFKRGVAEDIWRGTSENGKAHPHRWMCWCPSSLIVSQTSPPTLTVVAWSSLATAWLDSAALPSHDESIIHGSTRSNIRTMMSNKMILDCLLEQCPFPLYTFRFRSHWLAIIIFPRPPYSCPCFKLKKIKPCVQRRHFHILYIACELFSNRDRYVSSLSKIFWQSAPTKNSIRFTVSLKIVHIRSWTTFPLLIPIDSKQPTVYSTFFFSSIGSLDFFCRQRVTWQWQDVNSAGKFHTWSRPCDLRVLVFTSYNGSTKSKLLIEIIRY